MIDKYHIEGEHNQGTWGKDYKNQQHNPLLGDSTCGGKGLGVGQLSF